MLNMVFMNLLPRKREPGEGVGDRDRGDDQRVVEITDVMSESLMAKRISGEVRLSMRAGSGG